MKRLQQIFQDHAPDYIARFGARMPEAHRKVLDAICECRSGARGHHVFTCEDCSQTHLAKSSCGNRHCPVCQHEKSVQWVYRQQLRLLPCNYFLVTFTLPDGLRALARQHPREVYRILFDEAAASLRELAADKRFVGCKVAGFTGVLHTWGRQIQHHPHIHFIMAMGERFRRIQVQVDPPKSFKPLRCPKCQGLMVWSRFLRPHRPLPT